jgi:hypothetical protein
MEKYNFRELTDRCSDCYKRVWDVGCYQLSHNSVKGSALMNTVKGLQVIRWGFGQVSD